MKYFVILLIVSTTLFISAQENSNDGLWQAYFGNYTIKKCWNWHNEVQTRFTTDEELSNNLLIRTGIGHNLNEENNNVLLGYAWIGKMESSPHVEHRIYQQFITKQRFGPVFMLHRYRLEQQFFSSDFQLRFRYFLAVNYALNKAEVNKGAIYLSAYNEFFLKPKHRSFDLNRLYGGLGYAITDEIKVEMAYLRQTHSERNQNIFQVVVFKTFGFDKQR